VLNEYTEVMIRGAKASREQEEEEEEDEEEEEEAEEGRSSSSNGIMRTTRGTCDSSEDEALTEACGKKKLYHVTQAAARWLFSVICSSNGRGRWCERREQEAARRRNQS
jgi:hypothetical protein